MRRYETTYEEKIADAKLLLKGFLNAVRCETCNYRITCDPTDPKEYDPKTKKWLVKSCICSETPEWYYQNLEDLTFSDIDRVWGELFGDQYPTGRKLHSYVFDRFIKGLMVARYNNQQTKKAAQQSKIEAGKEVKKK